MRVLHKAEAVQLLNPMTIQQIGLGSPGHILHVPRIDHSDFKAILLQNFVKTDPVNAG